MKICGLDQNKIVCFFTAGFICFFFASCSSIGNFFIDKSDINKPQIKKEKPDFKLVYIKTAPFRFYDYGVLSIEDKEIKLELFKLGRSMGNIRILSSKICFLNDCAPKWPAAKNFFGKVSYGDLFEDILLQKDIFDGIGKQIEKDGIIQRFQKSGEIIFYERKTGHTLFRNMSTGVTISIDDYKPPVYEKE